MRRAIIVVLLFAGAALLFAVPEDFEGIIDFSISKADLVELTRAGEDYLIDPDKYLILEGTIASTLLVDPNPDTFQAWIELVDGEWNGLERIDVFRTWVRLGPDFAGRVVDRMPRNPGPEILRTNNAILLICKYIGWDFGLDGQPEPYVEAIAIR